MSDLDGSIGFMTSMGDQSDTFLGTLKKKGFIDHEIISFYTSRTGKQSYIKFGSMDLSAFQETPNLVGTTNSTTWSLNMASASISGTSITMIDGMVLNFDPMLPYLYFPSILWASYSEFIIQVYGQGVTCNDFNGACMFNFACNKIDSASASHAFEIGVDDIYGNSATVSLNTFALLQDGAEFGDSASCYIPIFKNGQGNQNVVTYG